MSFHTFNFSIETFTNSNQFNFVMRAIKKIDFPSDRQVLIIQVSQRLRRIMEIFSSEFFSALLAIIVIDLVLAGDNAIVIAMAARNLPANLRKQAIVWGSVGAIIVRSAMTLIVVWLLKLPGLLFIGGALLIWISYGLLAPSKDGGDNHSPASATLWGAMKIIIVADAVMGLDNVLAVAGAAHGNYLLVVLGLLISVPIVIWGSTLILRLVEKNPGIVYIGAGVLAWTAAKMMISEPIVKDYLSLVNNAAIFLIYVSVVGGVLWAGFVRNNHHLESRISSHAISLRGKPQTQAHPLIQTPSPFPFPTLNNQGETAMRRILIPVDGSPNSLFAVRRVIVEFMEDSAMEIHLLNVQTRFSRHIGKFLSRGDLNAWYQEKSEEALAPARSLLQQHGIPHSTLCKTGERAKVIANEAQRLHCHHIVMSTARKNSLTRMLENSTTNQVLELTKVPVEVVSGDTAPRLERWGVPAVGIGSLLGFYWAIAD
jgi:YjbE family integral membrane protein